jgi:AraC-like DNA-binding protein
VVRESVGSTPMTTKHPWLEPCISRQLVGPLLACAVRVVPSSAALRELSRLERQPRIPLAPLVGLLQDLEIESGRDDLGVLAAGDVLWGGGDLTHYLAVTAPSVGEGLELLTRFAPLAHEAAQFQLHARDGIAQLALGSHCPLARSLSDFQVIAMWRRLVRWTGVSAGYEAWFRHSQPRSLAGHVAALPGVRLRFDAPSDSIVFDARLLALPMLTADRELHSILVEKAEQELERVPEVQSLSHRVRSVLLEELHAGYVDCVWVSSKLGLSRRSLSRHLKQERTSYTDILNSVRREVGRHLLVRTRLSVQEIATRLGYSLTGAFTRAFRRWEGMSPMAYRRIGGGESGGYADTAEAAAAE